MEMAFEMPWAGRSEESLPRAGAPSAPQHPMAPSHPQRALPYLAWLLLNPWNPNPWPALCGMLSLVTGCLWVLEKGVRASWGSSGPGSAEQLVTLERSSQQKTGVKPRAAAGEPCEPWASGTEPCSPGHSLGSQPSGPLTAVPRWGGDQGPCVEARPAPQPSPGARPSAVCVGSSLTLAVPVSPR